MMASRFTSRSTLHNANNTTLELQQDLARSSPEQCVTLTHSVPSVQMYCALRTKLDNCSDKWLQEFLSLDGLDSLLDSLYQMSARSFTCISDAILQMDCISCVRCILNNTLGLEFFINSDVCTKKLTMALNCNETLPKKQAFEMLSAVCVFSNIGYLRVMEGLSYIKNECDQLHRFSMVVRDLQKCETVAFKTAVMTFINTLINCTPTVMERMRIRNEFIGLNLLEMLSYIRREEPDEDLLLQLEVFHERKLSDEESVSASNSIDLNSPQDLQDQIQARVFGTPKMANFVNILQDLLSIETVYKDNSGKLWQTVDNLIHHVIHTISSSEPYLHLVYKCVFAYQDTVKMSSAASKQTGSGENACAPNELGQISKPCVPHKFTNNNNVVDIERRSGLSKNINSRKNFNQNSIGSTGSHNSSSGQSDQSDNSESQNRTVTIFRHNMSSAASCQNDVSSGSGVNDKTVVVRNKYCSPTELTFFSNKLDDSQTSPFNNCSKSSLESSSSPYNADLSCSISSKLSKESQGHKTFNKTDESKPQCQMNINMSESKAYEYDQNKIKNKLDDFCYGLQDNRTSSSTPVCTTGRYSASTLKQSDGRREPGQSVHREPGEKCSGNQKPSNSIFRQKVPKPTRELNHLKWICLTDDKIVGREPCVWLPPIINDKTTPDYQRLDSTFQIKFPEHLEAIEEVVLLNANTRLRINLFLSRLDSGAEDLVNHLEEGDKTRLTLPMLQYLNKIMPCLEEIEMLRQYKGPRLELGMAEQFVLLLSDLPDYSILLEGHTMHREFEATVKQFRTSLDTMIDLAKLILNSEEFKQLMHLILNVGNYLNYNQFHGNAAGFKLSSLERLQEVKTSSPNKTLVHCIVQTVVERCKADFSFVRKFLPLEKAASFSMEEMKADISKLNGKLRYFMNNLTQASGSLQKMFQPFIEDLKKEFSSIQNATTELRTLTDDLAAYFCEDETRFNIQDCFKCVIAFCKDIQKCHSETMSSLCRQQIENKRSGDLLQKKLKSKLLSLEFGQNAGASSSMMEEKTKVIEKIVTQLHQGNFNPCIKSTMPTPDREQAHPLEMSCIPFVGSPSQPRGGQGTSDNVFLDTPELVCASYGTELEPKLLMRSSTQKIRPVATCTAQTVKPVNQSNKPNYMPSPITADPKHAGKKSATLQRKLFPLTDGNEEYQEREVIDKKADGKTRLELPSRKTMHRRSRSDMIDSICGNDKWIEYEKTREQGGRNAPLAEPESVCNLSILNLEKHGKFVTNRDVAALKSVKNVCSVEDGPVMRAPDVKGRKGEKKSGVGGFFSKIGRAVLKPRNVYSDGDEYGFQPVKERKKSISSDKENVDLVSMATDDRQGANEKKNKAEGNSNKVSRFFQRGGLYRSSKMKKKNQNQLQ
ncbi:inverted formin-2-like [Ruditapes philippinarum]|uniref:inverted formin-2-like n=1 Tax=Ruditapes philippinarum TaxID=129788 RepID=UPI00295AF346|nr:inverted formin-2-like [Ruditapes philippinarum]